MIVNVHVHIVYTVGSYSESRGIEIIRKHVAEFISQRDGVPCSYKNIYLVNGASEGIKTMLYVVMGDECSATKTGVMIPTPQYPLYTAALAELGAQPVRPTCNNYTMMMGNEKILYKQTNMHVLASYCVLWSSVLPMVSREVTNEQ